MAPGLYTWSFIPPNPAQPMAATERRVLTPQEVRDAWEGFCWDHVPLPLRHGSVINLGPKGLLAVYLTKKYGQVVELPPPEALFNNLRVTFLPDPVGLLDFKLDGERVVYFNKPKKRASPQK